jgi:hypothetical protein
MWRCGESWRQWCATVEETLDADEECQFLVLAEDCEELSALGRSPYAGVTARRVMCAREDKRALRPHPPAVSVAPLIRGAIDGAAARLDILADATGRMAGAERGAGRCENEQAQQGFSDYCSHNLRSLSPLLISQHSSAAPGSGERLRLPRFQVLRA